MIIRLAKTFLSEGLLLWFALAWLSLAFIPMLLTPNHSISFIESNIVVLALEISVCIFAVIWSLLRIRKQLHEK